MSLDNESIIKMLEDYEKDSKALKKRIFKLSWFMRGGMSLNELWTLGPQDREIIDDIISENLEITKDIKMPFF